MLFHCISNSVVPSCKTNSTDNTNNMPMCCAWVTRPGSWPLPDDQLKGLLKRYDINKDGKLSRKELKEAFRSLGLKFSGWRARRALHHADANGDGVISEEEMNELVKYASRWGFIIS
ncbi:unnamed protein product [Ilex paraguariensis]|uniref:EF-hand domain-containing protein n=1 Tax=Ilex paraguariensis TaxID=185542 RepID=A0ABC8TMA2_9AQUA